MHGCGELRDAILAEVVLTADVSKLVYDMRINGGVLDHDLLASVDGHLLPPSASRSLVTFLITLGGCLLHAHGRTCIPWLSHTDGQLLWHNVIEGIENA